MTVRIETNGAVATVILSRPEARNAVDRKTAAALAEAFRQIESDPEVRVGVLWGEGGHFCAGADLKAIAEGRGNRIEPDGDGPMGPTRMQLDKPILAAVAYAVAGGLELALWCDLRVIEETAVFGVFCRRFGVALVDGGTVRLPRLIGASRALDLILTGRSVDAAEALAMGLANRVVPAGQSRQAAEDLAREIASHPQVCLRNDRQSLYESEAMSVTNALDNELRRGLKTLASGEPVAGAERFRLGTFSVKS
jgi:enoyl-CoA hydratase